MFLLKIVISLKRLKKLSIIRPREFLATKSRKNGFATKVNVALKRS